MPTYYKSDSVLAFPVTYRAYNVGGKYTSETNITNLLKAFIKNKSFVIDDVSDNVLKVVIGGYYFEIAFSAFQNSKVPTDLYLGIKISNGYLVNFADNTITLDDGTNFKALAGNIGSKPAGCTYSLRVTDSNGNLMNTGFIPSIVDPTTGIWYDFTNIFKILTADGKIDPTYIDKSIAAYFPLFTVGAAEKLVYNVTVNPTTGKVNSTPYNVGQKGKVESGNIVEKWIYFEGGKPVAGNRITISTSQPGSYTGIQQGDIWFILKG